MGVFLYLKTPWSRLVYYLMFPEVSNVRAVTREITAN
jgi:hypothetical protein